MSELEQVSKVEESKYFQEIKEFCRKTVSGLHLPGIEKGLVLQLFDYSGGHFTIGLTQKPVEYPSGTKVDYNSYFHYRSSVLAYPLEFIFGATCSMVPVYSQHELKGYYPLVMVGYHKPAVDTLGNKFRADLQEEFSPERFVLYLNALGAY